VEYYTSSVEKTNKHLPNVHQVQRAMNKNNKEKLLEVMVTCLY